MGGYVRELDIPAKTGDGEEFTARLKPAKWLDVQKMRNLTDDEQLILEFQSILPNYLISLKGPTDAAGTQVTSEEFFSQAYFMSAVLEVGTEWVRKALPQNPQSPGASPIG